MKWILTSFFLFLVISSNAQGKKVNKIGFSSFEYSKILNDYTFYIYSAFTFGSGSYGCPKIAFEISEKSNDTIYIKGLYDFRDRVWPFLGCNSQDTIVYTNLFSGVNYFNISTSSISTIRDDSGVFIEYDTLWNQFDTTFYIGPTSIKEQNAVKTLSIYPNPTSTSISLPMAANELLVYNPYGQVVLQAKEIIAQQPVLVSQLNSGLYFVAVFDKEKNKIGIAKFYKE